jgi:hypothetical protein
VQIILSRALPAFPQSKLVAVDGWRRANIRQAQINTILVTDRTFMGGAWRLLFAPFHAGLGQNAPIHARCNKMPGSAPPPSGRMIQTSV